MYIGISVPTECDGGMGGAITQTFWQVGGVDTASAVGHPTVGVHQTFLNPSH